MPEKMKVAITFTDASSAIQVGGEVQRFTVISEMDMPSQFAEYLKVKDKRFISVSLSLVCENESEGGL